MSEAEAYSRLAGVYDEIVVDPCYSLWADFLDAMWRLDAQGVRTVLDVCCGTGLMAAELIKRGYSVVGADASAAMLARARSLLGDDVQLIEAILPELGTTAMFDAATSNFDGLNYLTPDDFRLSIQSVAGRIRPGGWFVFDLHTDAMMTFTIDNAVVQGESDGNEFVILSDVDPLERTCQTTIKVVHSREGEPFTETHMQYFHSDAEVEGALATAGFVDVHKVDEYTDDPVDTTTLRATWIARLSR